ncbi:nuclear transport factor 2 family protein [Agrobacterium sp. NPDC089420]|uniref:nuclear transport factor 2 family protein n=1 Tax=Agrobacterium sp. NPDC089420 TaxID=3363918 RepID=UPI00384C0D4B
MPQTITQTVTDYVHAMAYADEGLMRDVFDPRASIVGTFEGETEWLSLEDFVDQMRKTERGLPDHDPAFEILGIDKEGDSASVKLTTRFDGMDFYEYLSLLEHDGNWSIVHKLYHIKP